jgi:hypothetical protein
MYIATMCIDVVVPELSGANLLEAKLPHRGAIFAIRRNEKTKA